MELLRRLKRLLGDLSLAEWILSGLASMGSGGGAATVISAFSSLSAGWIATGSTSLGFLVMAWLVNRFSNPSSARLVPVYHETATEMDKARYRLPGVSVRFKGQPLSTQHELRVAFINTGSKNAENVRCQYLSGRIIRGDDEKENQTFSPGEPQTLNPVGGSQQKLVPGGEVYYRLLYVSREHEVPGYRELRAVNLRLPWRDYSYGLQEFDKLSIKVRTLGDNIEPVECTLIVELQSGDLEYDLKTRRGWAVTW